MRCWSRHHLPVINFGSNFETSAAKDGEVDALMPLAARVEIGRPDAEPADLDVWSSGQASEIHCISVTCGSCVARQSALSVAFGGFEERVDNDAVSQEIGDNVDESAAFVDRRDLDTLEVLRRTASNFCGEVGKGRMDHPASNSAC
jgi:hypothetical protein